MDSSPYSASFEDPRNRYKHESLLQDYKELRKETEITRKKLEMMKQKRCTLMAEVSFLRQRYKYLAQNQTKTTPSETKSIHSLNSMVGSKSNAKKSKKTRNESGLRPPVPRFDPNKKSKVHKGQEAIPNDQLINNGNEAFRNSLPLPDLNQNGNESSSSNRVPIFDLNQISREEEELEANVRQMAMEDSKTDLFKIGNDETQNDVKLSVCRNIKKGLNRAGKRKVSWQDPVALRV